ncbi:hypothetical protein M5D96_005633, partial [Drosophila gunungcola]
MDTFNVPMLAESSSNTYATEATSNHHHLQHQQQQQQQQHQQQQQQQLLMPHHHKDQMLAAGSTPMLPFYSHLQLQQKDATATMGSEAATVATAATSATADNFSSLQTIDASQLDGGISLSGLCDRFFVASPNPHSNSNMTLMGTTTTATTTTTNNNNINNNNNNNNNNNIVEAKAVRPSNGGSVIIESVTMPSFANILFPTHRTANECIDPALLQKNPQNNTTGTSIIVPPVEYHQLKPLAVNSSTSVSTSNFLSSTTAQLLDFEVQVGKDDSHISTTTTGTGTGSGSGSVSGSGATTISTATPTTITTTSNNNTANPSRSSLHSIEELAASSCAPKTTSPNSSASTTPQQHHQHQQQQQQQHHMQSGNHSGSNLSTDDESMSEDEFGLEIDDNGGKS